MWRVYYSNGKAVTGRTEAAWNRARKTGVQVVVRFPMEDGLRWTCRAADGVNMVVRDRDLWTGEDTYDPFGWGVKHGELIGRAEYDAIWERACADPRP